MPYVQRSLGGAITGVYAQPQPGLAEEFLPADNAEVVAYLAPRVIDLSNIDNLERTVRALADLTRRYANALKDGTYTTKTRADTKADFKAIYDSLP